MMKIIILNGSPKGDLSVTLQYARAIAKKHPQDEFKTINIAQRIKTIEKNQAEFEQIIADIRSADGILWAFPLYFLIVHSHYKRFIELIFERGVQSAFASKYAASLSSSIHFYDHTAHNYIHAICDDLGMNFVESFSPYMTDLLKEEGQTKTLQFGQHFLKAMHDRTVTPRQYAPLTHRAFQYGPGNPAVPVSSAGKKVLIVHDSSDPSENLKRMVERCQAAFSGDVTVINLHEVDIAAGCQGCMQCGGNYRCTYEGKDGFINFFRSEVMAADILVYAGTIRDRYLSSRWKMFFDRSFFNTHTPVLIDPTYLNEDDNIVCTECSDGYHLTEEYECAKRLGTDSTFDCDDVEYGLLDETGYYYTCEDCPSGCSNCSLENSSDTYSSLLCYGCSDGYYLSD